MKARPQDVAPLGEKFVQPHAVVFEVRRLVAHAEGHFGGLGFHAEFAEKLHEVRVGGMVENDEPRIDRHRRALLIDRNGVRVSSRPGVALDQRDVGRVAELPCRSHAGDTGPDDGDPLPHFGEESALA